MANDVSILKINNVEYTLKDSSAQTALSNLGDLAYKDSASGKVTPSGNVSVSKTTGNVTTISNVGSLPSATYTQNTETLSFNWGSLPTTGSETIITDVSATFSGTESSVTVS